MEEIILPGQNPSSLQMTVIHRDGEAPFVCLVVQGPDNALCMRLNKSTLKLVRAQIEALLIELRT
jgi:hypothetical protein